MQTSKISFKDAAYPDMLRHIDNPPNFLNILGELPKGTYVGIVGTRKPTSYGEKVTYQLASGLSPTDFANIINLMEINGKVRNLGAGQWVVR